MHKYIKCVTFWLLITGGINWGIFGLSKIDLISLLFGEMTPISRIIYMIVGLSAIIYAIMIYMFDENREN